MNLSRTGLPFMSHPTRRLTPSPSFRICPEEVAEALARRVRFYCRASDSPDGEDQLRVVDFGGGKRR